MPVPGTMADLSTNEALNSPNGADPVGTSLDNYLRAYQAILRSTNAKGADIASAATTDIGAATGEFVTVTGSTTITSLGTVDAGIVRTVHFSGAPLITHNATSLILPGNKNYQAASGDVLQFRSLGSGNWRCVGISNPSNAGAVTFVDTIADMKALENLTPGMVIQPAGRNSVGDCDMPQFVYFAAPTTENGVTRYNQTTGGGSFRANTGAVKLQWAGAALDGVTDDSAAWQLVAATGLPLIGWYGNTIINEPVTFSASILGYGADLNQSQIQFTGTGQLIVGDEGAHWTRIRLTSSVNGLTLVKNNGVSRWTLDKFIMVGQGLAANQIGVHFNTNASIYQCKVDGVMDGVTYPYLVDNLGAFNNNVLGSKQAYYQNFASVIRLEGSGNFDVNYIGGYFETGTNLISRTSGTMRSNVIDAYLDNVTNAYNSSIALSDPNTWIIDSEQFTQAGTAPTEQVLVCRKIAFSVYLGTDQTGVANNTATKITWDTESFDIGGNFDSTTNRRFTAPRAMRLYVYAQADITQNVADNDRIDLMIYVNGSPVRIARDRSRGTNGSRVQVSDILNLAKGDYVEIFALAGEVAGSGTHTISSGSSATYFVGHEI